MSRGLHTGEPPDTLVKVSVCYFFSLFKKKTDL